MSDSLRDLLLKAGFKPSASPQAKPKPKAPVHGGPRSAPPKPRAQGEPDLAQAFALRARSDRAERETAEREAREKAAARKERKRQLQQLLAGKALNRDDADQPRHFEFAGKIRRAYVSVEQMKQLNAGELGIVMQEGRTLLVSREIALAVQAVAADAVALLVDPDAPVSDDGVPDDLVW